MFLELLYGGDGIIFQNLPISSFHCLTHCKDHDFADTTSAAHIPAMLCAVVRQDHYICNILCSQLYVM